MAFGFTVKYTWTWGRYMAGIKLLGVGRGIILVVLRRTMELSTYQEKRFLFLLLFSLLLSQSLLSSQFSNNNTNLIILPPLKAARVSIFCLIQSTQDS